MSAAPANAQPVVEVTGLTKTYGSGHTEVVAVRDVTLAVARAQIVALVGPSGAGKSTLLTLIGLILPPNTGRIIIAGTTVFDGGRLRVNVRSFRRQHLGFVFPKANLIPFLTAAENVRLAMEINDHPTRAASRRAMELLEYLGVGERAEHLPSMLSSGEQQRVARQHARAAGDGTVPQGCPRTERCRDRSDARSPSVGRVRPDGRDGGWAFEGFPYHVPFRCLMNRSSGQVPPEALSSHALGLGGKASPQGNLRA
jgi:ABC-type lipoprotein export system ATPase subunit